MKYAAHDAWEWEWSVILQRRLIHLQNWGIWEKWDEIITDTNTLIKILIQEFNKEFIWLYHVSQLNECTLTLPLHVSGFWWWFWPDRERVWLSICNSVRLEMISQLVKWKKTLISLNLWEESEYTKVNMDGKRQTSKGPSGGCVLCQALLSARRNPAVPAHLPSAAAGLPQHLTCGLVSSHTLLASDLPAPWALEHSRCGSSPAGEQELPAGAPAAPGTGQCPPAGWAGALHTARHSGSAFPKGFLLLSLEGTEPSRSLFVFCDLSKPSNLLNVHSCQDWQTCTEYPQDFHC